MEDRNKVYTDEKYRIIDFSQFSYTAPESGIYDGELRYFAVNADWYPIVIGWIDHLAEIYAWKNAEDERYHGIQQILIFEQGVDMPIIDCGEIEDCIENSPTIINIINGGASGYNPENADKPIEEGQNYPIAEQPVVTPVDCGDDDKNKLWGAISSFIDFVDEKNKDLFQQIAVVSSAGDLVSILVGAIPIFETLPFDELPALGAWMLNNLQTGYLANVTVESLYELKCELFCEAVANDCEFTLEVAIDYFAAQSTLDLTTLSTIASISPVLAAAVSLTGMAWFHAISFLQMSVASLGEEFVGQRGLTWYLKAAQAGSLSGDSAWQVWCEDCNTPPSGEWLLVLDFANDYVKAGSEFVVRNAFTLLKNATPPGTAQLTQAYQKGAIFERDVAGETSQRIIQFASPVELSHARINWRRSDGAGTLTHRVSTPLYAPANSSTTSSSFGWTSSTPITNVGGTFNAVSQLNIDWGLLLNSQMGESELRYIEIRGQGALPVFAS